MSGSRRRNDDLDERRVAVARRPAAEEVEVPARGALSPASVMALQRTMGNQAVQRVLGPQLSAPAGLVQRTEPLETMDTFKAKGKKTFGQRPAKFGPVKIEFEDVPHVKYKMIVRPIRVSGLVYPQSTGERPGAPEPISGVHVSEAKAGQPKVGPHGENARNQGISDAQKGHIMALELGGPDIPQNIVPQWAQWQSNGEWRQMEKQVLAIAQKVMQNGNYLHFGAELHYKPYADKWVGYASKKSVGTPTGFTVTISEISGTTGGTLNTENSKIAFASQQQQNRTDDMMFMRIQQALAEKDGDSFDYADWNPQAKKEKKKKGKPQAWKGDWRDDANLNPFAQHEAEVRKQQAAEKEDKDQYREGWRDGYDYVEEDLDTASYLRGYADGRETFEEDYDTGFLDGFNGTFDKNETEGYRLGALDGIEHRKKGGKMPSGSAMDVDDDFETTPDEDEDEDMD
ncbi:MAG: DNA/RNA non-specific endonuclease [Gemmatimonadales bacterium]